MAGISLVEALRLFQQELCALEGGYEHGVQILENDYILHAFEKQMERVFNESEKEPKSCSVQASGTLSLDGVEYSINEQFQRDIFQLSDEVGTDELDAAQCLLESQDDPPFLGRSLLDCAIIRFFEQRKLFLEAFKLILELDHIAKVSDDSKVLETIEAFVSTRLLQPASKRFVPECILAMSGIKARLRKLEEKKVAAYALTSIREENIPDELEILEFRRLSLIQQHEALSVIVCYLIERGQATAGDFFQFVSNLKGEERYDVFLVHSMSVLGAFISTFGSSDGGQALSESQHINSELLSHLDDSSWPLIELRAAVQAWWIAEYCGICTGNDLEEAVSQTKLDQEDRDRSKHFQDALKAGALDFLLSVVGDVQPGEWHDPSRARLRHWLRRKTPTLAVEPFQVSPSFHQCLMSKIEVFADAFISNLPDVLRTLRAEEDEQRQFSQTFEQDLDLERFLLIIAYCYEGRPDAAANFWSDPDNNLAGFLHWASRRASTPLVTAFCEVLQAISENSQWATAAHEFLLDEGHHSSGKIRRSQSLTWSQIFKELDFFTDRNRQKPTVPQSLRLRGASFAADQIETEPESILMLECYLRLMTKLARNSEAVRLFLLQNPHYNLVDVLFELACGPIPSRLRGCVFLTLSACMSRKTLQESHAMWTALENWVNGDYAGTLSSTLRQSYTLSSECPERILKEMSIGFEDPLCLTDLLNSLIMPAMNVSPHYFVLPFPEALGSATRHPGIELYVDFVMGAVLVKDPRESIEPSQCRLLRLKCLDFILSCLTTFNENLIIISNDKKVKPEAWLSKTELETYICAHPFARIMEWMLHSSVNNALFSTIHQNHRDVGNAAPDSPLILSIIRAVQVMTKVLDLETTYQQLVKPVLKEQPQRRRSLEIKADHVSFADSLQMRPRLSVDLGIFCGFGHSDLTVSCLKLLEKISASGKAVLSSSVSERNLSLNRTILAFQANGEHDAVARSFASELMAPLDSQRGNVPLNYTTKLYILDFLLQGLRVSPNLPSISHLFLGLSCGADAVFVASHSPFAAGKALFHCLLRFMVEVPSNDEQGMRHWLLALKVRVMQILRLLWSSKISAPVVLTELREHDFFSQLLACEQIIHQGTLWEGESISQRDFLHTLGAPTLIEFLTLRGLIFEYLSLELCSVSQKGAPGEKKRLFSALNGGICLDGDQALCSPTVFDFYDFQILEEDWNMAMPESLQLRDIEILYSAIGADSADNFNLDLLKDILRIKRVGPFAHNDTVVTQESAVVEESEDVILEYLVALSRKQQIIARRAQVLKSWIDLLLIMIESGTPQGSAKTSFYLQSLQTVLPSLANFASARPDEAEALAKAARILVSDKTSTEALREDSEGIGNGFFDKFYQLFLTCLSAIGDVTDLPRLRSTFYDICYRFLTTVSTSDSLQTYRRKASRMIGSFGDRIMNAICDDAVCGEPRCQAAALILLEALIEIENLEGDYHAVEAMNQRNFISILVDSLRILISRWHDILNKEHQTLHNARMSLLLQLAKTRSGAKYLYHANIFRIVETSDLFTIDLPLQSNPRHHSALEQHLKLQAQICRILGAALLSRGIHNAKQGQRFLATHRVLVTHTLNRSSLLPNGEKLSGFEERLVELSDALIVIIVATGFLESEAEALVGSEDVSNARFR